MKNGCPIWEGNGQKTTTSGFVKSLNWNWVGRITRKERQNHHNKTCVGEHQNQQAEQEEE